MRNILNKFAGKALAKLSGKQKAGLFGVGWSNLSQMVGLVFKLGSTLILTRLLAPEAYGILGTAMAVLTTLEWLSDLGIQPALIRHEKGDRPEYLNTGWMMGLGRGFVLSFFAAISAWPLAIFYDEPALLGVLLVLSMRPLLLALRSPAFPLLRRNLNFKSIFIDEVALTVVGTACSIGMAFMFQSVWAIVLGTMAGAVTSVLLSYFLCPMRPRWNWDRSASKDIYSLGQQVFINTLVMAAWLNLDRLLGLRLLSPAEMGVYAIAFNLSAVLEGLLTRVCDVHFSMLAREENAEAQGKWHDIVCKRAAGWGMPLVALSLLLAPWAIWILYDSRYHGAGLIFAIMLARLMVRAYGQLQFQYLLAVAKVKMATYAYLVAVIVQVALFWPMVSTFGVAGMAGAVLFSTIALTLTQTLLIYRHTKTGLQPFGSTLSWATAGLMTAIFVYGNPVFDPAELANDQSNEVAEVTTSSETDIEGNNS